MTAPKAPPKSNDTARRFFEVVLPNLVLRDLHTYLEHQGTISFDVKGAGQWSFTFGSVEPVAAGLAENPDLALAFSAPAFEAFLGGNLDVAEAVRTREVTASGREFMLLEVFGRLLRPPAKDFGWDVRGDD